MSAYQIYQDAIKSLAAEATGHGTLAKPDGYAIVDNPLCGDCVEMNVQVSQGRIAALAHQVRGCLLCRAAASVIGKRALAATAGDIERISHELAAMLEQQAPPAAHWPELEAFTPVHGHRSRYRCVQLPFQALLEALKAAAESR